MKTRIAMLVLLLTAVAAGAPPDSIDIVVPVTRWPADAVGPEVFVFPGFEPIQGLWLPGDVDDEASGSGANAAWLAALLEDEVKSVGGEIDECTGGLRLTGPADALSGYPARIEAISRFLEGRYEIAVSLFAVAPGAELTAANGRELLFSARLGGLRGETAIRESLDRINLVMEQDGEVTTAAAAAEPVSANLVSGTRVAVQCRAISGDTAAVVLSFHISRAPKEIRRELLATGDLDLPEVPFVSVVTGITATLDRTDWVVVPSPFGEGSIAAAVTVQSLPEPGDTGLTLVDIVAAAGHPDVVIGLRTPGYQQPDDGDEPLVPDQWGDRRAAAITRIYDRLTEADVDYRALSETVIVLGGTQAEIERGLSLIGTPRSARFSRESTRLPFKDLARSEWFDPITGAITSAPPGLSPDLSTPVSNTPFVMLRGIWRRTICSVKAEVSTSAGLVQPVVFPHFEGERVEVNGDGVWMAEGRITRRDATKLNVAMDIDGRRFTNSEYLVDLLRAAFASSHALVVPKTTVEFMKVGEEAVLHRFSLK